ncbi:uncharacterized protein C8Q71DRAFT_321628 [Rhodofomes roseus]|uniref:Uncharacterized protein n=1 Tax=Rhodofomes roseus TaxID=34475 RepID=A0ABQ8K226_9APHY|nr:uncharacterized protein C8Q71DRAFT_321628 [Rhodofomes roseus]KAH9830769.1 hypothetical protein C8Q71DRAFT_321628 [Rhodofomes roseus]
MDSCQCSAHIWPLLPIEQNCILSACSAQISPTQHQVRGRRGALSPSPVRERTTRVARRTRASISHDVRRYHYRCIRSRLWLTLYSSLQDTRDHPPRRLSVPAAPEHWSAMRVHKLRGYRIPPSDDSDACSTLLDRNFVHSLAQAWPYDRLIDIHTSAGASHDIGWIYHCATISSSLDASHSIGAQHYIYSAHSHTAWTEPCLSTIRSA